MSNNLDSTFGKNETEILKEIRDTVNALKRSFDSRKSKYFNNSSDQTTSCNVPVCGKYLETEIKGDIAIVNKSQNMIFKDLLEINENHIDQLKKEAVKYVEFQKNSSY